MGSSFHSLLLLLCGYAVIAWGWNWYPQRMLAGATLPLLGDLQELSLKQSQQQHSRAEEQQYGRICSSMVSEQHASQIKLLPRRQVSNNTTVATNTAGSTSRNVAPVPPSASSSSPVSETSFVSTSASTLPSSTMPPTSTITSSQASVSTMTTERLSVFTDANGNVQTITNVAVVFKTADVPAATPSADSAKLQNDAPRTGGKLPWCLSLLLLFAFFLFL